MFAVIRVYCNRSYIAFRISEVKGLDNNNDYYRKGNCGTGCSRVAGGEKSKLDDKI